MSENTNNQNNQQQPTTPTPEASGGQGSERTFTQSELDRIVQDRLARDRASRPTASDRERDLAEREQKLAAREAYIECREHLKESGLNMEYLELVDTSDPQEFKAKVEKLQQVARPENYRMSLSHQYGGECSGNDAIADAFKPKGRR